jgi:hypothetical protein
LARVNARSELKEAELEAQAIAERQSEDNFGRLGGSAFVDDQLDSSDDDLRRPAAPPTFRFSGESTVRNVDLNQEFSGGKRICPSEISRREETLFGLCWNGPWNNGGGGECFSNRFRRIHAIS